MTCVFHVSPFDGGWCVKICDTGELLFFGSGGEAERQARGLAAAHPGSSEVHVHDRQGRWIGRWVGEPAAPSWPPSPPASSDRDADGRPKPEGSDHGQTPR
jgi:hypothetical protein